MSATHPNIGGMHRYRIHYRDEGPDLGCPTFTTVRAAYDARHAEERFLEGADSEGWEIIKIERIREEPRS